jgi:hypothetical protein
MTSRVYITALNSLYEVPEAALEKLSDGDEKGFWDAIVKVPNVSFDPKMTSYSGGWAGDVPEGIENYKEYLYSGRIDLPSEPGSRFKRSINVVVVTVEFEYGREDLIASYADLLAEAGFVDACNPWLA